MTPDEASSKAKGSESPAKRAGARRSRRGGRGRRGGRKPTAAEATPEQPAGAEDVEAVEAVGTSDVERASEQDDTGEPGGHGESFSEPYTADAPMADSPIEEARRQAAEEALSEPQDRHDEPLREPEYEPSQEAPYHSHHDPLPEPVPPPREERRDFQPAAPASVTQAIDEVNRVIADLKSVLDTMEEVLETLELAEVQKNADEREIQSLRSALRQIDRRGPDVREFRSGESQQQPIPYQPQGRPPQQQQQRHDRRRHGRR